MLSFPVKSALHSRPPASASLSSRPRTKTARLCPVFQPFPPSLFSLFPHSFSPKSASPSLPRRPRTKTHSYCPFLVPFPSLFSLFLHSSFTLFRLSPLRRVCRGAPGQRPALTLSFLSHSLHSFHSSLTLFTLTSLFFA